MQHALFPDLRAVQAPEDIRDTWRTPPAVYEALSRDFGPFSWDLFASRENHLCANYFTAEDNAFEQDWSALEGCLFGNPPFSRLPEVCRKASETPWSYLVLLMPANRTQNSWWHEYVIGQASRVVNIQGRVEYLPPPGVTNEHGCMFNSTLVIYQRGSAGRTTLESWKP